MKEVMAIIRMKKVNETKQALAKAGFSSMTATGNVSGRGKGLVDQQVLEGAAEGLQEAIAQLGERPRLWPKRIVTLVVPDDKVEKAVLTIISANKTGKAGDGKIFVLPIADSIRVRTAEYGDAVLN